MQKMGQIDLEKLASWKSDPVFLAQLDILIF